MAYLKLKNITKMFGNQVTLNDISLDVNKGEFIALLGPSGCGKTTLLRILAGLETPTEGDVIIDNKVMTRAEPSGRNISMVFQSYALFPHLSVTENILFGLKARKLPKQEQQARLRDALKKVSLEPYKDKLPGQLSGGQRQRVALARAIVSHHPICLMDEPLSNLDAKLRAEMRSEIRALQQQLGLTVIYVTHDQVEAMSMADRIVLLNKGQIEQVGEPATLYQQPQTTFAAQFIGSPAMNIFQLQGDDVLTGVRPEHVMLKDSGLPGRVKKTDYHGDSTLVFVEIENNQTVCLKIDDFKSFAKDEPVFIQWRVEDSFEFDPVSFKRRNQPKPLNIATN